MEAHGCRPVGTAGGERTEGGVESQLTQTGMHTWQAAGVQRMRDGVKHAYVRGCACLEGGGKRGRRT